MAKSHDELKSDVENEAVGAASEVLVEAMFGAVPEDVAQETFQGIDNAVQSIESDIDAGKCDASGDPVADIDAKLGDLGLVKGESPQSADFDN